jgi:hypothetical protein
VFRRSKPESPAVPAGSSRRSGSTAYDPDPGSGTGAEQVQLGKGRPTPSRKEAEAAARARAKAAHDPKQTRGLTREQRSVAARAAREGIKSGDDRYLRPRDAGPVRRFVRDFVDARLSMAELAVPGFLVSFVLTAAGAQTFGTGLLNALLLVIIVDCVVLRFRLNRELKSRFPEGDLSGTTLYALVRALQIRFLRLPKTQVKLGQKLPERYR